MGCDAMRFCGFELNGEGVVLKAFKGFNLSSRRITSS